MISEIQKENHQPSLESLLTPARMKMFKRIFPDIPPAPKETIKNYQKK